MNKIKALYDVVKAMKEKKEKEGALQIKVERDGQTVWQFQNEFQHNAEGSAKCKLQTQWNWDGNEGKHESTTEFTRKNQDGCPFQRRMKHFHHHHHHGPFGHEHTHHHGFKHRADAILFFLKMLNELQAEEQGEKLVFSLELDDAAQKLKEKCHQHLMFHGQYHPLKGKMINEIMLMDQPHIVVNVIANKDREVEKATVTIRGSYEKDGQHEINATAEIQFTK